MNAEQEIRVLFDYMLLTTEDRVAFAIRCVLKVYHEPAWVNWAHDWLSGKDPSVRAAAEAARAAEEAWVAAKAAKAAKAARAAWVAAWWAAEAARGAAGAARVASAAEEAARVAAESATARIDLQHLAEITVKEV